MMGFLAFAGSVQILPDFSLIIHIVMILTMIWILNRTFFRPVNEVLAERAKREGGRATETDLMLNSASQKEIEYKDALLDARNEGYEIIENERALAVKNRVEKVAMAKEVTAEDLQKSLDDLSSETELARKEISAEAAKLAEEIKKNILRAA